MFTVITKVNKKFVSSIYCHNITDDLAQTKTKFSTGIALPDSYYYEFREVNPDKITCGKVDHFRDDGIHVLIGIILADIERKKNDKAINEMVELVEVKKCSGYKHIDRLGIKVYDGSIKSADLDAKLTPKQRKQFSKLFGCQTMSGVGPYASDVEAVLVRMFEKRRTGSQLFMD